MFAPHYISFKSILVYLVYFILVNMFPACIIIFYYGHTTAQVQWGLFVGRAYDLSV